MKAVYSLKSKLIGATLLVLSAIYVIMAAWTYVESKHEVDELFDAQLATHAKLIIEVVSQHTDLLALKGQVPDVFNAQVGAHKYEQKIIYQVLDQTGKVRLASYFAPKQRLITEQKAGFFELSHNEHRWRLVQMPVTDTLWLVVGQRLDIRQELIEKVTGVQVVNFLIGLPLLALLLSWILSRGLGGLQRLSQKVADLKTTRPDTLLLDAVPEEIVPLVNEINRLLQRMQNTLNHEREFLSSAAHEIKTPLAVLHLQIENLSQSLNSPALKAEVDTILKSLQRTEHLAEQLLALQKVNPQAHFLQRQILDVAKITHEVLEQLAPMIFEKNLQFDYQLCETTIPYYASSLALQLTLRNLVANAIRYTPEGGTIHAQWQIETNQLVWTLEDSGPGIDPAQREQVFQRFYRQNQHRADPYGCGLGLAIVKSALEGLGGRISLQESEALKGLKVVVNLPYPAHE